VDQQFAKLHKITVQRAESTIYSTRTEIMNLPTLSESYTVGCGAGSLASASFHPVKMRCEMTRMPTSIKNSRFIILRFGLIQF
jgi:hypothetical protein